MATDATDHELLERWRTRRDEPALAALCDRHGGAVAATCRRLGSPDATEAAQAVFITLARRAGSVDGPKLGGWLAQTARRITADQRRAARRRRQHEQEAAVDQQRRRATDAASDPGWHDARPHLDEALASISPGQREAIVRFYLHGQPQAAVAAELGCSVDAVKNRIHVGLDRLRAALARRGVAIGAAGLASGLAGESAAAEPAIASACVQAVLTPGSAAGAASLAAGAATAMLIKTSALIAASCLLGASAIAVAVAVAVAVAGGEPRPPVPAPAPAPPPAATEADAAEAWRLAAKLLGGRRPGEHLNPSGSDGLAWRQATALRPLDAAQVEYIGRAGPAIAAFARGAAAAGCSWGGPPASADAILQSESQPVVVLVRVTCLRARWHAEQGRSAAAVDDLLTCWDAGRLLGAQPPTLWELALSWRAAEAVIFAAAAVAPRLESAQRRRLHDAIDSRPPPALTRDVVVRHAAWCRAWFAHLMALAIPQRQAILDALQASVPGMVDDRGVRDGAEAVERRCEQHLKLVDLPPAARRIPSLDQDAPAGLARYDILVRQIPRDGGDEVLLAIRRAQLLAGLETLDLGEAGLARHPDPVSGAPFACSRTATGLLLVGSRPGPQKRVELIIGDQPGPPDADGTGSPPVDSRLPAPAGF